MKTRFLYVLLLSLALWGDCGLLFGQFSGKFGDETELYAETKQVNQFFRRFNCEEGRDGERFYEGHPLYHDREFRKQYLDLVFDRSSIDVASADKRRFVNQISEREIYLDFHQGNWFAEVTANFFYKGRETPLTLFMELEPDSLGYKWVISGVDFEPYRQAFMPPVDEGDPFLHPLSHELDFMNLAKVFQQGKSVEEIIPGDYKVDQLSLFINDWNAGRFRFSGVTGMQFHFFQLDGWYFRLEDIQREGFNTGWLITALSPADEEQKAILKDAIQHVE